MADETKVQAEAAAAAPAKVAEAVADTAAKVVKETAVVAKRERAKTARRVKRQALSPKRPWPAAPRQLAAKFVPPRARAPQRPRKGLRL